MYGTTPIRGERVVNSALLGEKRPLFSAERTCTRSALLVGVHIHIHTHTHTSDFIKCPVVDNIIRTLKVTEHQYAPFHLVMTAFSPEMSMGQSR